MCIVQTHRHESATIKTKPAGKNGVIQIDYFGIFTDSAALELVQKAREECERARVHIARIDRAVIACDVGAAVRKGFAGSMAPGAVVVRPDQRDLMLAICDELSASGALRLVFLDHARALAWADSLAADLARQEAVSRPRYMPLTEERDRLLVGCQKDVPANVPVVKSLLRR